MSAQPEAMKLADALENTDGAHDHDAAAAELRRLQVENEALKAEVEALGTDAARYRWVRMKERVYESELFIGVDSDIYPSHWAMYEDEADAAIDAAIAKAEVQP